MAHTSSIPLDDFDIPNGISLQVMITVFSGVLSSIEHCALVSDFTLHGIDRALCSHSPCWLPIEHCALVLGRLLRWIEQYTLPSGVTPRPWLIIVLPCVYCGWFIDSLGLDRALRSWFPPDWSSFWILTRLIIEIAIDTISVSIRPNGIAIHRCKQQLRRINKLGLQWAFDTWHSNVLEAPTRY
jgi:hypothetical protein